MLAEFHWILKDTLAGSALPGLLNSIEKDVNFLKTNGFRAIVTLTEKPLKISEDLHEFNLIHFPISDMGIPTPRMAGTICDEVVRLLDGGNPVLVHCKAGMGRTGTILACCLIHFGMSPKEAIADIRRKNRGYIQNSLQENFVHHYAEYFHQQNGNSNHQITQTKSTTEDVINGEGNKILEVCMNEIPNAVAAGLVDLDGGHLIDIKTVDSHPEEVIRLLAPATKELFEGEKVRAIEKSFKEARKSPEDGGYFQYIIIFSANLIHFFSRLKHNPRHVLTCVCTLDTNIGIVIAKGKAICNGVD